MDNETKQMFEIIINKIDKMDGRLDNMDGRLDKMDGRVSSLENELKEFREEFKEFKKEMKEEHKLADGKIDMIYNKLNKDIEEIKNKPEPKFKIVREI